MTERPEPPLEKPIVKFEDLRFSDIQLDEMPKGKYAGITSWKATVRIDIDGLNCDLNLFKNETLDPLGRFHMAGCGFQVVEDGSEVTSETPLLKAQLLFHFRPWPHSIITSNISRNDKEGALPNKFGEAFYEKMLDFIQVQVNIYQENFLHTVSRFPDSYLEKEKWRKKFEPILSARGYDKVEGRREDEWQKMYVPEKKS